MTNFGAVVVWACMVNDLPRYNGCGAFFLQFPNVYIWVFMNVYGNLVQLN